MSKFLISLLTAACFASAVLKAEQPLKHNMKQKELLDKMEKAVDPKDAAKKWKTLVVKMQMQVPMQQQKMSVSVMYKFPDKSKGIATIPGAPTTIQVVNGKQAWKETVGLGIQMKTGVQLAFAKFECRKSDPALKPTEIYKKITLDPYLYKIGEYSCYKLVCELPDELKVGPSQVFVDNKEFLIRRSIDNQLTDMGVIPVSIDSEGYKVLNGIKVATTIKTNIMGIEIVGKVLSIKPNEKIPDSEFELPKNK
jgi:hypothetical protein